MHASQVFPESVGHRRLLVVFQVLLAALLGWNLLAYGGLEHEQFTTRHYFPGWEAYYGGYGDEYFVYPHKLVSVNKESQYNLKNFEALQNNRPGPGRGQFELGYDGAGRMFSSGFLPALIQRLSFGTLNVHNTYLVVNILFWLAAVFTAFAIARRSFNNAFAALIAASLVASYPVLTLMFQSFKIQYAHCVVILVGLYLAHYVLRQASFISSTLAFAGLFAIASFSGGAHVLLSIALITWFLACHLFARGTPVMRDVTCASTKRTLAAAIVGLAVALIAVSLARGYQDLPNVSHVYSMGKFFEQMAAYVSALVTGADRSKTAFLGYPGDTFFTKLLWMFAQSIWNSNPIVICGAAAAFAFCRAARPFVITGAVLFLPSHAPEMLVAWVGAYGYGNGPTTLLFIIAFAGLLGNMMTVAVKERPAIGILSKAGAVLLLATTLGYYFTNRNDHVDNFYFSWGNLNRVERIHAYHNGRHIRCCWVGYWQ